MKKQKNHGKFKVSWGFHNILTFTVAPLCSTRNVTKHSITTQHHVPQDMNPL